MESSTDHQVDGAQAAGWAGLRGVKSLRLLVVPVGCIRDDTISTGRTSVRGERRREGRDLEQESQWKRGKSTGVTDGTVKKLSQGPSCPGWSDSGPGGCSPIIEPGTAKLRVLAALRGEGRCGVE